jgi:hypothetical protein
MHQHSLLRSFSGLLLLFGLALPLVPAADPKGGKDTAAGPAFSPTEIEFFEKQVQPILKAHCFKCHGEGKVRGGLRLTTRAGALKGGDLGPAVLLDKPKESPLLRAVNYTEGLEMPPSGKLAARDVEVLTRWVGMGLPYSATTEVVKTPTHEAGKITEEARRYWAYQPVKRPEIPKVRNSAWVRNPIDAFILADLEAKRLTPVAPADRVTLARRVWYDLTGLPPTPAEVDAFVNDTRPDAYELLIDRVLASPGYGEKWGRHWLDLVRYAETHGYERDSPKPAAWKYRDYVIKAFNDDKPYDRFLLEQLAGDELDDASTETLTATGYYRLGIWDDEPADRLLLRYDVLDGIVATTGQVVLGMSVGCARCHDHKKDPIPQKDYYRLLAFFQDVTDMNAQNLRRLATATDAREKDRLLAEKQAHDAKLYSEIYQLEQRLIGSLAVSSPSGFDASKVVSEDVVDLRYRFYRDTWTQLPDFDTLKVEDEGRVGSNRFSLAPASRKEAMGLVFTGKLQVHQKGKYTFRITASEGVRLSVGGKRVIDEPGKGRHSAEGEADLPAGPAAVRLEYFNTYSVPELRVNWSGPGFRNRLLSDAERTGPETILAADSRKAGWLWSYTTKEPADGWFKPEFKDEGWTRAVGGFGTPGTPGARIRTIWDTKNIWLRRTFTVDAVPSDLALDLHHDDEVEVYLNGVLIHQAKGYTVEYERIGLGLEALKAVRRGVNVLAVHCHQTTGGQYIDAGLVVADVRSPSDLMRRYGEKVLGAAAVRKYRRLQMELEKSRVAKPLEVGIPIMCVEERGRAPTHVLIRGLPTAPGAKVEAGFPEVLTTETVKLPDTPTKVGTSGKRLALARWLTRKDNPLTARVMANRLWQFHFGRGIVPTSSDFGKLGEQPTHPALLDWLASEFVERGWSLKAMHKLLMTSSTYRLSSLASAEGLKIDPANRLFWRFNMRRLTAEEVRDSMLMVSGKLDLAQYGPSVYPKIPDEVLAGQSVPGQGWVAGKGGGYDPKNPEAGNRRSVYVHVKRSLQVPILATHDQADTDSSCAVRYTTTVPTQALGMLNGDFTNEQAAALAERIRIEIPGFPEGQVKRIIRLTTGRVPGADEVKRDLAFLNKLHEQGKVAPERVLTLYALLALNTNEFVYLD